MLYDGALLHGDEARGIHVLVVDIAENTVKYLELYPEITCKAGSGSAAADDYLNNLTESSVLLYDALRQHSLNG